MTLRIITQNNPVNRNELNDIFEISGMGFVKAVVDIEKQVMVIRGELHADEEAELLNLDSKLADLWGINFYPDDSSEDWIELDSMINIRPSQNNRSRGVEDISAQQKIREVVGKLVV